MVIDFFFPESKLIRVKCLNSIKTYLGMTLHYRRSLIKEN